MQLDKFKAQQLKALQAVPHFSSSSFCVLPYKTLRIFIN
jgi:hypothetical protein